MQRRVKNTIKGRGAQINPANPYDQIIRESEVRIIDDEKIRTSYLPSNPKTIVNRVDSPDLSFNWSINPYQGCEHGCIYCYARNSHSYWGYSAGLDFETKIIIKENAPELLRKKLESKKWDADPIMLSGNTDPYQPAEREYRITRQLLKVFLEYQHPVQIITKNALILRDIDLLEKLAALDLVSVAISITTMDEELRRTMEPRTASGKQRIKTIEKLTQASVPTMLMLAPIIPGLNDNEIMSISKQAARAGAFAIGHNVVRLNGQIAEIFKDWIRKQLPIKADRVIHQIEMCHAGKLNDSRLGVRHRGTGVLADMITQQVKLARMMYYKGRKKPILNRQLYAARQSHGQLSLF